MRAIDSTARYVYRNFYLLCLNHGSFTVDFIVCYIVLYCINKSWLRNCFSDLICICRNASIYYDKLFSNEVRFLFLKKRTYHPLLWSLRCNWPRRSHQQILEILVDTVDAVDVIATHRHFIDFKYVKDIIGIL